MGNIPGRECYTTSSNFDNFLNDNHMRKNTSDSAGLLKLTLGSRKTTRERVWKFLNVVVAVATIWNVSALGALLSPKEAKATSGSVWTTNGDCGDESQDVNHYSAGDHVYINGDNFDSDDNPYNWEIKGQGGGASTDPNIIVASGTHNVDEDGNVCFDAYTVQADDGGEYKVKFGGKNDNYRVDGGTIEADKKVDADGNGTFEKGNDWANDHGFDWQIDGGSNINFDTEMGVTAASHVVTETMPTGYHLVGWYLGRGSCDELDGTTLPVNLTVEDKDDFKVTFCNALTPDGVIEGTKYYDWDRNAGTSAGDEPLSGWTIFLDLNENDQLDSSDPSTTTDINGHYSFTELADSDYDVCEVVPFGWTHTPNPAGVSYGETYCKGSGVDETVNFYNYLTGAIHGQKFNDLNGDGIRNDDSSPLSGWTIFLDGNENGTLDSGEQSTVTASGEDLGWYWFTDLQPGTYSVCEVPQTGWTQTYPANCHTVTVPQPDDGDSCIADYQVNGTEDAQSLCNFGNQEQASVTVLKNVDENGDGDTTDLGETGSTAWTWDVNPGNQNYPSGSTQTVTPGSVTINEDAKSGYSFTSVVCDVDQRSLEIAQGESVTFETFSGGHYTCTYTNTRDTGTIELKKVWSGTAGQTTLNIGTTAAASDIDTQLTGATGADPLTTGVNTVGTGTYYVSETGGLSDYSSTLACADNDSPITPGTDNAVTVAKGHAVVCTFTNTKNVTTITLDKTGPATATPGQSFTYSLAWKVDGNASATNAVITDPLPANTTFVSATEGGTYASGTGIVTWNLGTKAPGTSGTVSVTVIVSPSITTSTTLTNTGTFDTDQTDPVSDSVTTTVTVPTLTVTTPSVLGVSAEAKLGITKSVDKAIANPSDTVTYTIVVSNTGEADATSVVVTDNLPDGFTFVEGGKATKTWKVGTLAAGASQTLTYQVKVGKDVAAGEHVNRAFVTADFFDPIAAEALVTVKIPQVLGLATTGVGLMDYMTFILGIVLLAAGFIGFQQLRRRSAIKA